MTKASILLIYTGGTIGMKADPADGTLRPFDFGEILQEVPELSKLDVRPDTWTFDPLIDSSDVEPSLWQEIALLIQKRYDQYDGFVILHGTDTMAYTASALSFMLENLSKPVILTGSQLPVGALRTDGRENLVSAVEIAAARDAQGDPLVPEVAIYFDSKLLRGNRATKVSADNFRAFRSPNHPPLAEAGINIRYAREYILRPSGRGTGLSVHTALDTRVSILKIHPGITPQVVRNILCGPQTRAVILETYGSGNALTKDWFLDIVREAAAMDKILLNVTQCLTGSVNMDLYATGRHLKDAGVLSGLDLTTESALAKLFFLMGTTQDNVRVRQELQKDLRGEISA
jgi:L-asparaginase